jgi:hypothetical protein
MAVVDAVAVANDNLENLIDIFEGIKRRKLKL